MGEYPQIIHVIFRMSHYKPSIFGYPHGFSKPGGFSMAFMAPRPQGPQGNETWQAAKSRKKNGGGFIV